MTGAAAWWVVILASALVSGMALVGILVTTRRLEPLAAGVAVATGAASAYALAVIGQSYQRADAVLYAFAFAVAGIGGGYALASTLLPRLARPLPPVRVPEDPPCDTRPAVLVALCVEPPHYDPGATAAMLATLTEEGLLDASIGGLPFLFFAHKARYRSIDDLSPALGELQSVAARLGEALSDLDVVVDWSVCSGEDRLTPRVADLVSRGHRRILVAPLGVAGSAHMEHARVELDALRLDEHGVTVETLDTVAASDAVPEMLAARVLAVADGEDAGVVLVGHGQPEERARRRPQFAEAETMFLSRMRMLLTERGIPDERVRIAWSEWVEPDVTSQVRHLAALGCARVVVVPAVFPVDTLSTRIDIVLAANRARVGDDVPVLILGGWGDDDVVVSELHRLVVQALERAP